MSDTSTPTEPEADRVSPEPAAAPAAPLAENVNRGAYKLDPTRYGDWEKNGRCIDF